MEPQDTIYCYDNKEDRREVSCLGIVAVIILAAFTFVVGTLIGAAIAVIIFIALPSVIVLAIILGLLLILTIILMVCNKKKYKKCKYI